MPKGEFEPKLPCYLINALFDLEKEREKENDKKVHHNLSHKLLSRAISY